MVDLHTRHSLLLLTLESATLKNDNAEDAGEEEGVTDVAAERKVVSENEKRRAAERQPTGRVVGIIKRNWRS